MFTRFEIEQLMQVGSSKIGSTSRRWFSTWFVIKCGHFKINPFRDLQARGFRWPLGQSTRRAIAEAKERLQRPVFE
jgi:hypothetical protein